MRLPEPRLKGLLRLLQAFLVAAVRAKFGWMIGRGQNLEPFHDISRRPPFHDASGLKSVNHDPKVVHGFFECGSADEFLAGEAGRVNSGWHWASIHPNAFTRLEWRFEKVSQNFDKGFCVAVLHIYA